MSEIQITYGLNPKKLKKGREVPFARIRGRRAEAILEIIGSEEQATASCIKLLSSKVADAINLVNSTYSNNEPPVTRTVIDYHSTISASHRESINRIHWDREFRKHNFKDSDHGYEHLAG